jgi:hypothetical protein
MIFVVHETAYHPVIVAGKEEPFLLFQTQIQRGLHISRQDQHK